jgi:7-cyano-7-deazaguanine synthase
MKVIILLSGGLDSTTMVRIAQEKGYEIYALTFDYGQKHSVEIEAAKKVCRKYGILKHTIAMIDIKAIRGSALTDNALQVKKNGEVHQYDPAKENIPLTYVPARNTIFLSYALGYAEVVGASKILIGINAIDYSGYPDCRPEYLKKFNEMARIATAVGVKNAGTIEVEAPLLNMTKAEIIAEGIRLGVEYRDTVSCYDPDKNGAACGQCDACILRLNGFKVNDMRDSAQYQ